ncbi:MAG: hypothetical protein ACK5CT_09955 [Bacteroidota bacterium]|jgi:hypothetical protein
MEQSSEHLVKMVLSKCGLAKDVIEQSTLVLKTLRSVLQEKESALRKAVHASDPRIPIQYKDRSAFEAEFRVGDDLLIFAMHSSALVFDHSHPIWKNSWVSLDQSRGTVGMISVYNFLSDSIKYERRNDSGFLIARLFIGKDGHCFAEGKRQLGVLFNDYSTTVATKEILSEFVNGVILFSLDVDVNVPAFDQMKEISVLEAMVNTMQSSVSTGKRLGFKFESEGGMEG